jgi:hypothetical protein
LKEQWNIATMSINPTAASRHAKRSLAECQGECQQGSGSVSDQLNPIVTLIQNRETTGC